MTERHPTQPLARIGRMTQKRADACKICAWLVLSAAIALLPACRVRRTVPDKSTAPNVEQPRASAGPATNATPVAEPVTPAVLLLVGFGDAGFAMVRSAKQESRWLRDALTDSIDPFGRLAAGLTDLALRRWAFDGDQVQSAGVSLWQQGTALLSAPASETLLDRTLGALNPAREGASSAIPVSLLASTPETDWSLLNGPIGVVARASSGEFAVLWTELNDPGEEPTRALVVHVATRHGAVIVSCACEDTGLVRQATEALANRLEQPHQLQAEASRWRDLLTSEALDDQQVAILVLGRRAVIEGGGAQIVSAAGADWNAPASAAFETAELDVPNSVALSPDAGAPEPLPLFARQPTAAAQTSVDAGRPDAGAAP